ncbi:hypothetical protein BVRB_6g134760 [Beta vulgaris subsp. vulgaris]|nr:hypothetical protein BVRB_6g134760 [Beta vulgaris subsp. vulgaris]
MAITRRSTIAKQQEQATPLPLPPPPPPPPVAENNNNNQQFQQQQQQQQLQQQQQQQQLQQQQQQQQQQQKQQKPQQQQPIVAETVSAYEQTREQRIKENRERLQKLGIVDLSLQIKSIVSTKRTPRSNFARKSPLKSPSLDSTDRRRSSRLQNAPPVTYTEPKEVKSRKSWDIVLEEGAKPEFYTEEHEKLLGNTEMPWTFNIDGYRADGTRIYDQVIGKTCHQCRQKTLGLRTHCCKCNLVQGQFCGDCLYARYGEHVVEANQNPDWICPPCRGICNCSLCRHGRGWAPTGSLYKRIKNLGFKSVAHYLIATKRAPPESEKTSDASQSAKRCLPFEGMQLPDNNGSEDKALVTWTEINPQSDNNGSDDKAVVEWSEINPQSEISAIAARGSDQKSAGVGRPRKRSKKETIDAGEAIAARGSDQKSAGVGRPRKQSKKETIDAGEACVRVNGSTENEPVSNMNGPNTTTSTGNESNSKRGTRQSTRKSKKENVDDDGEESKKTSVTPGDELGSSMNSLNSSGSKVSSIGRRLRPRNQAQLAAVC